MVQTVNPFGDMDFTKIMANFNFPGVEPGAVAAIQRKTIETLTAANQIAFEGFRATAQRQSEIVARHAEALSAVTKSVAGAASPEEKIACQCAYLKDSVETGYAEAREVSELLTKAANEALALVNQRTAESISEASEVLATKPAKKK